MWRNYLLRRMAKAESPLTRWKAEGHRGIVEVVTGGGKTVFALSMHRII